jgi:hypothetical protein
MKAICKVCNISAGRFERINRCVDRKSGCPSNKQSASVGIARPFPQNEGNETRIYQRRNGSTVIISASKRPYGELLQVSSRRFLSKGSRKKVLAGQD